MKHIVLQYFSDCVAVFVLSETFKLLVWKNKNIPFWLKQYLVEFWHVLEVILGPSRETLKNMPGLSWILWSTIICEFWEKISLDFNRTILLKIKDWEEGILEE